MVKFTRLNFFVPVPQVRDFEELNAFLRQRCEEDRQRRLRGQPGTKAQLLVEDYMAGESVSLVEALTDVCSEVDMRTPFEQNLMLADLVSVEEFFERGPQQVRRLRLRANVATTWVEPEALVDFVATDRLEAAER